MSIRSRVPYLSTPSPNFADRQGAPVSMLVFHYTGMETAAAALARLCDPAAEVSAHYVITETGVVHHLVDEAQCAWHAGKSAWGGQVNVNPISIGIEMENPGHEWGYRPFPAAQMQAALTLARDVLARHPISPSCVVGHSDVAPSRKQDPGERFDWAWLAAEGVGLWPEGGAAPVSDMASVQKALAAYGYGLTVSGIEDGETEDVIMAFQRHFRPWRLLGSWDEECQALLNSLLALKAQTG